LRLPLLLAAAVAMVTAAGGCVDNAGLMVILGNQVPMMDAVTHVCSATAADGTAVLGEGVLDLDVGTPQPYVAYPIVQNRLQALGMASGVEPNRIMLEGFHINLIPPAGFNFPWTAEAPNHLEPAFSQGLEPGAELTAQIQAVTQNQAKAILAQFGPGGLSPVLTDQVIFTAEMHAVGTRNGDTIESDVFRFPIRMCVGCLQTGFADLAQYNYPGVPLCTVAPKPNIYKGNPCNFAQDSGPLLCCLDDSHKAICPSPDM
jgi:hypothetical protein